MDRPGIACRDGKIAVGDSGRGRHLVVVPIPPGAVVSDDDVLTSCDGPPTSVLVLIPDHSGFRGSWHLRDARTEAEWDEVVGGAFVDERDFGGVVIARGECAQGIAGKMGGGPEYLLRLDHGQAVEIVRQGRLYGRPSCIRLACVAGTVVQSIPRDDAEERAAGAKWAGLCDQSGGEPVEIEVRWGGGSARHREHAWSLRPILVGPHGTVHVFDGAAIPGICEVLEDQSVHSGYASGRCACYRLALAPGVTYRGNEHPDEATAPPPEPEKPSGNSLGALLRDAGVSAE
jgi:hypothetical protein